MGSGEGGGAFWSRSRFRLQIGKLRLAAQLEPSALGGCSGVSNLLGRMDEKFGGRDSMTKGLSQITDTEALVDPQRGPQEALIWNPSPFLLPAVPGSVSPVEARGSPLPVLAQVGTGVGGGRAKRA